LAYCQQLSAEQLVLGQAWGQLVVELVEMPQPDTAQHSAVALAVGGLAEMDNSVAD